MVTICPRPSAGSSLPHRPVSPRNGLCCLHFEPRRDTDQHGSKENLQRPPVRIHSLRVERPNAAIEPPREPANVRAGVHASPCGFRFSGNVQQYPTSPPHAESVNSSAEPRASIALHRPTSRTRRREGAKGFALPNLRALAPSRETAKVFNSQRTTRSRHIHCGMSPPTSPRRQHA